MEIAAKSGYQAVTMARVAEHAGVSRANLYQHYDSRDDLICAAFASQGHVAAPAKVWEPPTALERVTTLLDATLDRALLAPLAVQAWAVAAVRANNASLAISYYIIDDIVRLIGYVADPDDAEDIARVLGEVIWSVLLRLTSEGSSPEDSRGQLDAAARVLLCCLPAGESRPA